MSPLFLEIWTDEGWTEYYYRVAPKHSRKYYKFRSVCRMAFWIPLAYLTLVLFLSLGF